MFDFWEKLLSTTIWFLKLLNTTGWRSVFDLLNYLMNFFFFPGELCFEGFLPIRLSRLLAMMA